MPGELYSETGNMSLSEQVDCMSKCVGYGTLAKQSHVHANKNLFILEIFKDFLKTFKGKRRIINWEIVVRLG